MKAVQGACTRLPITQPGMELTKATNGEKKLTSMARMAVARIVTNGGVARDGNTGNGFRRRSCSGSRRGERRHGADAVAQQGAGETGVLQKVLADDGGDVLVVCNVLGEDDERDRT